MPSAVCRRSSPAIRLVLSIWASDASFAAFVLYILPETVQHGYPVLLIVSPCQNRIKMIFRHIHYNETDAFFVLVQNRTGSLQAERIRRLFPGRPAQIIS